MSALNDQATAVLGREIRRLPVLEKCMMSDCQLSEEQVMTLCDDIQRSRSMDFLDLSLNSVRWSAAVMLRFYILLHQRPRPMHVGLYGWSAWGHRVWISENGAFKRAIHHNLSRKKIDILLLSLDNLCSCFNRFLFF